MRPVVHVRRTLTAVAVVFVASSSFLWIACSVQIRTTPPAQTTSTRQ